MSLTVDFAQFADGDTWFSHSPDSNVKPEGVRAGAGAAAGYLLRVLGGGGMPQFMAVLPRIHADVMEPGGAARNPGYGVFGFYSGVTNIVVRVEHEYKLGGTQGWRHFCVHTGATATANNSFNRIRNKQVFFEALMLEARRIMWAFDGLARDADRPFYL